MYNLQGDVVGLADAATGKIIAKYLYDAWGKCVSVENAGGYTIGTANPFRYRGYYYDTETGFYYLNSRYYNPEIGRFLNADAFVTTNIVGVPSANILTYCDNNPTNRADSLGLCWFDAKGNWCHDNWEYLYGYERKPKPEVVDLTEPLNEYMQKNADTLKSYKNEKGFLPAVIYFYDNVKDGGKLDIKLSDEWKFETGKMYLYNGKELRYDDPGNINFGYVGAVIFPLDILCFGAGANQVKKYGFKFGDFSTFFDDQRDNEMIKYGYSLYINSQ